MAATEDERRRGALARLLATVLTVGSVASGVNALVQVGRTLLGLLHGIL